MLIWLNFDRILPLLLHKSDAYILLILQFLVTGEGLIIIVDQHNFGKMIYD